MMKKYRKKILIGLLLLFIGIQFIPVRKNDSGDNTNAVSTKYPMSDELMAVMKPACMDCHSNTTVYPWYASIQPVGMWLAGHVKGGKQHLNFSNFTHRKLAYQNHKFEEIIEMVEEKNMPLKSYTWIHKDAQLSPEDRTLITSWARAMMDTLRQNYPADSLVMRR